MPWTSPSFDEYLAVMTTYGLGVTMTGRPTRGWQADEIISGDVGLRWGQDGGGVAVEGAARPDTVALYTPLCNLHEQHGNGSGFDEESLMLMPAGSEFCAAGAGWSTWMCIDIADPDLTAHRQAQVIRVGAEVRTGLISAATRVIGAIEQTPALREDPCFATAAMADLGQTARAAVAALGDADAQPTTPHGPHRISRVRLADAVRRVAARCAGERMVLDQLAREADVSLRTLQNAFHDYFGAPVHRYLHLRNLHEAHRQLAEANVDETTVTRVAMDLGFWELGRFAQEYREVYGERPSDTLRRSAAAPGRADASRC